MKKTFKELGITAVSYTHLLWKIAKAQLGDGKLWTSIYELNKDTIKNPNMLTVGQEIILK